MNVDSASTSAVATFGANTTAGNLIAGIVAYGMSGGTTDVTSMTESHTMLTGVTEHSYRTEQFYCENITGGSTTFTVNFGSSRSYRVLMLIELSGCATSSALDGSNFAHVDNWTATTDAATSGNITTSDPAAMLVGFYLQISNQNLPTAGTNFTQRDTQQNAGGNAQMTETRLLSSTGTYAATFTPAGANYQTWVGGMAFKEQATSPNVGSISTTTYAPSVSVQSGASNIEVGAGSIVVTGQTPSADTTSSRAIPIDQGSQQFTTYAPTLGKVIEIPSGTGPEDVFPDDTNLGITGYDVFLDIDYNISVTDGAVALTGYDLEADSSQGTFIPIDVGAITTTGYAPVDVSSHVPSPSTATQTITGYVPLIGTSHFRTPDSVEITITGYDVSTAPTTDIYIDISSGAITSASSAPSLIRGTGRAPDTATLGFTGYTPDAISEDVSWEFFPDEGSATYSTYDLTLSIIEVNKSIPIAVGSLVIPGWKPPFGSSPSVEVGARKRRKILGFLK